MSKDIERVKFPERDIRRPVKCVQMYIDGDPVFRFSSSDGHGTIVGKALAEFEIPFGTISGTGGKIPSPKGKRYEVVGAGNISVYGRVACLDSFSIDYNIGPDRDHAVAMASFLPDGIDGVEVPDF